MAQPESQQLQLQLAPPLALEQAAAATDDAAAAAAPPLRLITYQALLRALGAEGEALEKIHVEEKLIEQMVARERARRPAEELAAFDAQRRAEAAAAAAAEAAAAGERQAQLRAAAATMREQIAAEQREAAAHAEQQRALREARLAREATARAAQAPGQQQQQQQQQQPPSGARRAGRGRCRAGLGAYRLAGWARLRRLRHTPAGGAACLGLMLDAAALDGGLAPGGAAAAKAWAQGAGDALAAGAAVAAAALPHAAHCLLPFAAAGGQAALVAALVPIMPAAPLGGCHHYVRSSAFFAAAAAGHADVLRCLLAGGALSWAAQQPGASATSMALDLVAQGGHVAVLEVLRAHATPGPTFLCHAAHSGSAATMTWALSFFFSQFNAVQQFGPEHAAQLQDALRWGSAAARARRAPAARLRALGVCALTLAGGAARLGLVLDAAALDGGLAPGGAAAARAWAQGSAARRAAGPTGGGDESGGRVDGRPPPPPPPPPSTTRPPSGAARGGVRHEAMALTMKSSVAARPVAASRARAAVPARRAVKVCAKYGENSRYFDLTDLENTTGSWDMYGQDSDKRYPGMQNEFFMRAGDVLKRREALRGFVALTGIGAIVAFGAKGSKDAKLPIINGPQTSGENGKGGSERKRI
ncbi:hypothetical protein HT031_004379 [Scenedesmus sp. PABB004]|nr:hypothetical protein HT031_004379 [Scenedesmus sp. PABB004]